MALDSGRVPLVVSRMKRYGEHVDDHQMQIARRLADRGLALMRNASEIKVEDLMAVGARRVRRVRAPREFPLAEPNRPADRTPLSVHLL